MFCPAMFHRLGCILLALAVFTANAYCACIPVGNQSLPGKTRVEKPVHPGCHGHEEKQKDGSEGPDHQRHDCGHCTGTVSADTSSAKTTMPSDLSPLYCGTPIFRFIGSVADSTGHTVEHSGLSPPVSPPTLFSLACSLTI